MSLRNYSITIRMVMVMTSLGPWTLVVNKAGPAPQLHLEAPCMKFLGAHCQVTSEPMQRAQELWGTLKPTAIKPIFESADVAAAGGREIKKRRL